MHSALDQTLPETPTAMTNRGARSSLPASAGSGVGGNRELHQDKREKKRGKNRKREKDTHTHRAGMDREVQINASCKCPETGRGGEERRRG